MNKELFIKLLKMTASDNDNEALIAIRKCNKMLKEANKTWDDVLNLPAPQGQRDFGKWNHKYREEPPHHPRAKDVDFDFDIGKDFKMNIDIDDIINMFNKARNEKR